MANHCKLFYYFTMKQFWIIAISCVIFGNISEGNDMDLSFPENFIIGAGSSAYQIEGAWNASGKGESIWDYWAHENQQNTDTMENGDIAASFYYKYREDVQHMKSIGLKFFRFSIAWTRIFPTGFTNSFNEDGIQFYKDLIADLVANGIQPIVTLYHWDHPQVLEDLGGWTNELMIDWFVWYAERIFQELGDVVKIWVTFNEPNMFCPAAYSGALLHLVPDDALDGVGQYMCMHNVLKAHARTYHMYDEKFRATQQGQLGIVPQCPAFIPTNSSDTESADTAFQFVCGWVLNPIYKGDYPEIMKTRIAMISKAQGYQLKSRLPEFSDEWISTINGTADYLGLNYYTAALVSPDPDAALGKYNSDDGLIKSANASWPTTLVQDLYVTPEGLGILLRKIRDMYDNPPVRIMENGYSDAGELDDYDRIQYHYDHLMELLIAVKQDNCTVLSYSIWCLLDDYEWNSGYKPKFGIISVDFNDPDRARTVRRSASWLNSVLESNKLQPVPTSSDSPKLDT